MTDVVDIGSLVTTPETDPYIRMLVYGPPGVGKSIFAARSHKPLLLASESPTSLRNFPDTRETPMIPVRGLERVFHVYQAILKGELSQYETIIIDSFDELTARSMDAWLIKANSVDANKDKYISTWPDYNRNQQVMRRLALAFNDLPKHLILVCHEDTEEDKAEGRKYKKPNLPRELSKTMVSMMSVIGRMTVDENKETGEINREIQIEGTRSVEAKTRIIMDNPVVNPTFDMFVDANNKQKGL